MRALVDTNVIINFLEDNMAHTSDDSILMHYAIKGIFIPCISSSAVTDIYYILTRNLHEANKEKAFEKKLSKSEIRLCADGLINTLLRKVDILTVGKQEIIQAFSSTWKDKEDAVQYFTAMSNDVDTIITWNKRDYTLSSIPVYDPAEFITLLQRS